VLAAVVKFPISHISSVTLNRRRLCAGGAAMPLRKRHRRCNLSAMKRLIVALVLAVLGLLCPVSSGSAQDGNADQARPDLKLWSALKRSLTDADGEEFFRQNMKDSALPVMVGTLISSLLLRKPLR
jgi:hypothetical protein